MAVGGGDASHLQSMESSASGGMQDMSTSFVFPMNFPSTDLSSRAGLAANQHLTPMQQMLRIKEDKKSRESSIASGAPANRPVPPLAYLDPRKPSTAQIVAENYVNEKRSCTADNQEYPLKKLVAEEQLRREAQKRREAAMAKK